MSDNDGSGPGISNEQGDGNETNAENEELKSKLTGSQNDPPTPKENPDETQLAGLSSSGNEPPMSESLGQSRSYSGLLLSKLVQLNHYGFTK